MMPLYSLGLALALLLSSPVWGTRMLRGGRYREGLRQRLGGVPRALREMARGRDVVWLHAVSVGETLAATRLVRELEEAFPRLLVVISTTTPTGQKVARERFGADRVFFFPLDFAFAVRPYLRALRPRMLLLLESELWPRVLVECERHAVPVAVVNARVSDRSLPRYLRLRLLWRPLLAKLSLFLAQSEEDARRWVRIGAPATIVRHPGNLKYDIQVPGNSPLAELVRRYLPQDAKVLVCGSTHEGEEETLLRCFQELCRKSASETEEESGWSGGSPSLPDQPQKRVMLLAPRHPERSAAVAEIARGLGLPCLRLSEWRLSAAPVEAGTVLLVDTVGELAPLYALAHAAFVGGSLIRRGGHNPLEPAQFGVPVAIGPHFENFRDMVTAMRSAHAVSVLPPEELPAWFEAQMAFAFHTNPQGVRARDFYESQAGATERTVEALRPFLNRPEGT